MEKVQIAAGSIAGLIFALGSVNMLLKAWQTKDLRSYSLGQLLLNNVGNLLYWLYVVSLPFGPIYFMHGFFTFVSLLMLAWYFAYRSAPVNLQQGTERLHAARKRTFAGKDRPSRFKPIRTLIPLPATSPHLPSRRPQRNPRPDGRVCLPLFHPDGLVAAAARPVDSEHGKIRQCRTR